MKNTIRNTLLITVAATALVAGGGLASAQGMSQKAPEGKTDQQQGTVPQKSDKATPAPSAQTPDKAKPAPSAQAPEKPVGTKSETTGQGGAAQPSQSPGKGAAPSAAGGETKSVAPAALSTEQHVKIRETLRGEKAERLTSVPFSITVGEAIPRTVHRYRLPVSILVYAPQYRDYEYILVGDEILIVDPRTMRIVAVIPA
jgi:Protein of unknown function (DUF1236)